MRDIVLFLIVGLIVWLGIQFNDRMDSLKAELRSHTEMPVEVQTGYFITKMDKLNVKGNASIYMIGNSYTVADTINMGGKIEN